MKKTMSKALSVILVVVMLAVSVPFAFAADPIALSTSNVTEWPVAVGEMYVGQKVGDCITFSGGKVEYNGVEVSGKFVHYMDSAVVSVATDASKANLKFVPDDTTAYTGFNKMFSSDVTFKVKKTIPVLKDESNPPVASSVLEGETLSASSITGGTMKNPYNDTINLSTHVWKWENPDMVITDSGEYPAKWVGNTTGYEIVYKNIYVEVEKSIILPLIENKPTIDEFTYNPKLTWADISLNGGKAIVKDTTTEILGTFDIADKWKSIVPYKGSYEIDVIFNPVDTEAYSTVEFTIPVTVNPAPITFETEDGTGIPTITVDYGRKTNDDMGLLLKQYVPEDVKIQYIDFRDLEGNLLEHANKTYDPGSYTFTCRARTQNKNYAATMLTFNVVINKAKINPKIEGNGNRMIIRDTSNYQYNPKGTFDLYVNDVLVLSDIPYNEYFTYEHTTSGDKNFKAVYDPGDDNRYEIDPITRADGEVKLDWPFSSGDGYSTTYTYGETVTVEAPATDPAKPDKPYYGFAGWNVVEGNPDLTEEELASPTVSFEMPDGGVKLEPTYQFSLKLFFEWIWAQIVQFFTFIINAVKDLIALAA